MCAVNVDLIDGLAAVLTGRVQLVFFLSALRSFSLSYLRWVVGLKEMHEGSAVCEETGYGRTFNAGIY